MQAALAGLGLSMEMTGAIWVLAILVSFVGGLVLVFFYAAARPRFGPGPKTAVLVEMVLAALAGGWVYREE